MALRYQVLGAPGRDNALWVTIDTGHAQHHVLFDCGQGCPEQIPWSRLQAIEALCFSHFHMDHVAGFDGFFRAVWDRADPPVRIFGPEGTCELIHHRAQSYTWNLMEGTAGELRVTSIGPEQLCQQQFFSRDGFASAGPQQVQRFTGVIYQQPGFFIEAVLLDHGIPSVGYIVREQPRQHIDTTALDELGLSSGPWLADLKDPAVVDEQVLVVGERTYAAGELREKLCWFEAGDCVAYLTDFRLDEPADFQDLAQRLRGCRTLVCENNFRNADSELARRSHHLISREVGQLAALVNPERLILIHVSDRYTAPDWLQQLDDVRRVFPRTWFPAHWQLGECERDSEIAHGD